MPDDAHHDIRHDIRHGTRDDRPPRVPALVEPGPELTSAQRQRFARHLVLGRFGTDAQRRVGVARVLVVGAGGLGSPVLAYLAAAGVGSAPGGRLGVVDDDVVEVSNLQRQILHGAADLGRRKVDSAAEAVAAIDPGIAVERFAMRLDDTTAPTLVAQGWDVVVDGSDNFATRYVVDDVCAGAGVPVVWGSILRFDGQVSVFWARHGPRYRDVFPAPPPPGSVPSCGEAGVLGALCGAIGSVMAMEVLKLVTGVGEPLIGRMLVHDALDATWATVPLRPGPSSVPPRAATVTGPSDRVPLVSPQEVAAALSEPSTAPQVWDVREPGEYRAGRIDGAVLVPLGGVIAGTAEVSGTPLAHVPPDRPIVVHCRSGARSAQAAQALRDRGFTAVVDLSGGIVGWANAGLPVVGPL